jgi:N-acetylglutamate synthase-like GNAT family acetyltransferase
LAREENQGCSIKLFDLFTPGGWPWSWSGYLRLLGRSAAASAGSEVLVIIQEGSAFLPPEPPGARSRVEHAPESGVWHFNNDRWGSFDYHSGMQIRKAQPHDLNEVIRLYRQLNPNDVPLPDSETVARTWNEILATKQVHFFVVEENEILVCSCVLTIIPNLSRGCAPYGIVENVVTATAHRRQGIASKLLKIVLGEAWQQGCYKVMLLTGSKRQETLAFYEKVGFQPGKKTGFVAYPTGD